MAHNFWYGAAAVAAVFVGIPIVFRRLLSPGRDRTFEVRPTPKPSASSRTRSSRPVSSSPTGAPAKPRQTYDPALMQELEQVIQQFKHDSLAFFIYEESLEKNLSIEKKDILSAKYGDFGIKPSFLSYLKKGSWHAETIGFLKKSCKTGLEKHENRVILMLLLQKTCKKEGATCFWIFNFKTTNRFFAKRHSQCVPLQNKLN